MASEPPSPSGQGPLPLAVALTPTLPSAGIDHFIKYFPLLQCVALMLNYQNVFGLQTKNKREITNGITLGTTESIVDATPPINRGRLKMKA